MNTELIENLLVLAGPASPQERAVLKMAVGAIKQLNPDYDPDNETDERVKLTPEEYLTCFPEKLELCNGIIPWNW